MTNQALATTAGQDGWHAAEVTIESVSCSYSEEDAMEERVAHVHHATNLAQAKESDYCWTIAELLMKMLHFQGICERMKWQKCINSQFLPTQSGQ